MKKSSISVATVIVLMVLTACSTMPKRPEQTTREDYSYAKKYLSWLIQKEMKKHEVTGLSIALVDDQKVVWTEGFGFADVAGKVPAKPETIYRVGSISKLFTATAAMQLVEQGKLDIDKPLQTYLPEFSIKSRFPNAAPITARSIMTHHSGLPSDLLKGMWTKHPEPFEKNVEHLRDEYAAYPPNFVFAYSNIGVTTLGHALEKVAGKDFSSYMESSLLQPLGMNHSHFSSAPDRSPAGAKAYRKGDEAEELPLRDVPAGGLNTTVLDLSRFMEMVFAGGRSGAKQIVSSATLTEMLQPQNADVPLDLDFRIGLGWMLGGFDIKNAGTVAHHGGATLYHRSQMIVLPEHKLGVVVVANSASAVGVVQKVAAEAVKLALEAKTGIRQPEQKEEELKDASLSQDALRAYEGRYATVAGVVQVSTASDHLEAEIDNTSLRLVPRADGLFGVQYRLLGLFPVNLGGLEKVGFSFANVAGRDIVKVRADGNDSLVGERIRPTPLPAKLSDRVGEYEVVNRGDDAVLFDDVKVRQNDGFIIVDYSMPVFLNRRLTSAVVPLSDDEVLIQGLWRGMGETIRVVHVGGEELLQYSGYLLRKKRK